MHNNEQTKLFDEIEMIHILIDFNNKIVNCTVKTQATARAQCSTTHANTFKSIPHQKFMIHFVFFLSLSPFIMLKICIITG